MSANVFVKPFRKPQRIATAGVVIVLTLVSNGFAGLTTNPAMPIDKMFSVHVIQAAEDDGSNPAADLGTASQRAEILDNIDTIYAQAGIDVSFDFASMTYNNSFALQGDPNNNHPRPGDSDLNKLFSQARDDGVLDTDPHVDNLFLLDIVPGFSDNGTNSTAGYSYVGAAGATVEVGSKLPGFSGGRQVQSELIAHELGHNLGLNHVSETSNLLHTPVKGAKLNGSQIDKIRRSNLLTTVIPEPATLAILGFGGLLMLPRRRRHHA